MKIPEKKVDLRIKRTHKLLSTALIDLLCRKGSSFNSITVNQICEQAMVHRTTFYKHFEDKFDLLSLTMEHLMQNYLQMSTEERLKKPIQSLFKISDDGLFVKAMDNQKDDEVFGNFIAKYIKELIKRDFLEIKKKGKTYPLPIELIEEFHAGVIGALITWWFHQDKEVSAEQMDKYYYQMISKDISL